MTSSSCYYEQIYKHDSTNKTLSLETKRFYWYCGGPQRKSTLGIPAESYEVHISFCCIVVGGLFLMNNINWDIYKEEFTRRAQSIGKSEKYITENLNYADKLFKKELPIIYDYKHLSKLIGVHHSYFYQVTNDQENFYRKFHIKKHNGNLRTIHEPLPTLKNIQKWLLENLFSNIKISKFAKAYVKEVSIKENVRFHRGQKTVLKLDLKNFFPSIKSKDIYHSLMQCGYSKQLTVLITELCVINNRLPQGAPTSPILSNIVLKTFDDQVSDYCIKNKIRYTRYADDMTFSGDFNIGEVIAHVKRNLSKLNLKLNDKKTRVLRNNTRQLVTGITVNEKIQVAKPYRKNIRLEMYFINKYGLSDHLNHNKYQGSKISYVKSLLGKIKYCIFINPKDYEMIEYEGFLENILEHLEKPNL